MCLRKKKAPGLITGNPFGLTSGRASGIRTKKESPQSKHVERPLVNKGAEVLFSNEWVGLKKSVFNRVIIKVVCAVGVVRFKHILPTKELFLCHILC